MQRTPVPNGTWQYSSPPGGCGYANPVCHLVCNPGFCGPDCATIVGSPATAPHTRFIASLFDQSTCSTICDSGWFDCDHDPGNGCEHQGACVPQPTSDASDDACEPGSVPDGGVEWIPPSAPAQSCTDAQIAAYYADCFGDGASAAACNAWPNDNASCNGCIQSTLSSPTLGPIISSDGVDWINIGGCVALVSGDSSPTSCGAALLETLECENAACLSCGPIADLGSFEACTTAADTTVCAPYVAAGSSCADAGAVYDTCVNFQTFEGYYDSIVPLFCNSPQDGGVDAGAD